MTGQIRGVFHAAGGRMLFAAGTKGGVFQEKAWGCSTPHSLNSFVFRGLPLLFGFHNDDTEKSEGDDSDPPPKRGVPTGPDSGTVFHASIRPQGVAIVGIYPCGKARKRRPGAARIKRRMAYGIAEELPETDHGLEPVLAPGGRADELENPVRVTAYIGWEIFNGVAFLVGEWVRYGVRAGQIVLAIPPTVILFFGGFGSPFGALSGVLFRRLRRSHCSIFWSITTRILQRRGPLVLPFAAGGGDAGRVYCPVRLEGLA